MSTESTIDPPCPETSDLATRQFLADVQQGLRGLPKTLPCKYFYDQRGSQLFDAICELPEYYPTRTEAAILQRYAGDIAKAIGSHATLIEYGSGSSTKTQRLLQALPDLAAYIPVDISREHLLEAAAGLREKFPHLTIRPLIADFTKHFDLPADTPTTRRVAFFPGSTIGNFQPPQAVQLLKEMQQTIAPGGSVVLGIDLVKDIGTLEAAYDDAQGVTAEFNLNLLTRINRELEADFHLDAFEHVAKFDTEHHRIEMQLRSLHEQAVRVCDQSFEFAKGETIRTEHSHKYTLDRFGKIAQQAGLKIVESWTDEREWFAVVRLKGLAA